MGSAADARKVPRSISGDRSPGALSPLGPGRTGCGDQPRRPGTEFSQRAGLSFCPLVCWLSLRNPELVRPRLRDRMQSEADRLDLRKACDSGKGRGLSRPAPWALPPTRNRALYQGRP